MTAKVRSLDGSRAGMSVGLWALAVECWQATTISGKALPQLLVWAGTSTWIRGRKGGGKKIAGQERARSGREGGRGTHMRPA